MANESPNSVTRIQELNDAFRRSFLGGVVVLAAGFESLPVERRRLILARIRAFDNFDEDNDPHGERAFGVVQDGDVRCFWKIDYYDTDLELTSPDPTDPSVTTRVLTMMLPEEYQTGRSADSGNWTSTLHQNSPGPPAIAQIVSCCPSGDRSHLV
jgi:Protein of unknown function (DUF3768)